MLKFICENLKLFFEYHKIFTYQEK